MPKIAVTFALAGALLGCAPTPSQAPTPPVASAPASATSSAPRSPAAQSGAPEQVKATARTQYAAAVVAYNKTLLKLNRKYPTFETIRQANAFYTGLATAERTFTNRVRKITFPPEMAPDVRSLLRRGADYQVMLTSAGKAKDFYEFNQLRGPMDKQSLAVSGASNLIREDLGLPNVK